MRPKTGQVSWTRRDFLKTAGAVAIGATAPNWVMSDSLPASPPIPNNLLEKHLFPKEVSFGNWETFKAKGYVSKVSGIVYSGKQPPTCGVPLGGISTGSIDLEAGGVFGFSTLFIPLPQRPQLLTPFLGFCVEGETTVLAEKKYVEGGHLQGDCDPRAEVVPSEWATDLTHLEGVRAVDNIRYWGHYPIADLDYQSAGPVQVELRAWSPFIPGATTDSDIPAAVFEVHLHNTSPESKSGTLAMSFPGPTNANTRPPAWYSPKNPHRAVVWPQGQGLKAWVAPGWPELAADRFERRPVKGTGWQGLLVQSPEGDGYALGLLEATDHDPVRTGDSLSRDPRAWSRIDRELPEAAVLERTSAAAWSREAGASIALRFALQPGEVQVRRFVLAWYAPRWKGGADTYYRAYSARYANAVSVAERIAADHAALLQRMIAWQDVIYAERSLPPWLQDGLINALYLIPKTSLWARPQGPVEWAGKRGLFGMLESPRGCPQMECLPCTWYGTLPILFFFPDLMSDNLKGHLKYQRQDGAAVFAWGWGGQMNAPREYDWQVVLNGFCFVDLLYRGWIRNSSSPALLARYFPAVKKNVIFSMNLSNRPNAVISMPEGNRGMEWWEHGDRWQGMTAHAGGLRLSQLEMAAKMAQAAGDQNFERRCRDWLNSGKSAMETQMWDKATRSYLRYYDPSTKARSDDIMANQFDAEWVNHLDGLPPVFRKNRVRAALNTIQRTCLADSIGAVSFAAADGHPELAGYGIFVSEIFMLGMTFIDEDHRTTGLETLRHCLKNLYLKEKIGWDQPNMLAATGGGHRTVGSDYYQNTVLWAVPAALTGQDIAEICQPGGFVERIIHAGRVEPKQNTPKND